MEDASCIRFALYGGCSRALLDGSSRTRFNSLAVILSGSESASESRRIFQRGRNHHERGLTWWPDERPAAQKMYVQVWHAFPGVCAVVDDESVT